MAIEFLESRGYAYAVVGGLANQVWGEPRLTYDVDLLMCWTGRRYWIAIKRFSGRLPKPLIQVRSSRQ
jgi:hypothetical protein